MTILLILLLLFLTFLGAYVSSAETALFSLSSTKVKTYKDSPDPRKRLIADLLVKPRDLLVTIFILNTIANILLQNVASSLYGEDASWVLKIGVPFLIILLLGEIIPKYVGLQNNVSLSYVVAPSIYMLQKLMGPIRRWIVAITTPLSRIIFFYLRKENSLSKDEILSAINTSKEKGALTRDEVELITGYLHLQEAQVKELMWPREDILYYDVEQPLSKLVHLFVDQECTRVPVCKGSLDHILGIMTATQFFIHQKEIQNLNNYLAKPFYVPESAQAKACLRLMEEENIVLALVVDEYGSVSGIISIEDLIEVVVGEIEDLRDQHQYYVRSGKNEIIASGKLELAEFNEIFDAHLTSENNMVSLGGWLTEKLGDIPKSGSHHNLDGFMFQVLAASETRVTRLYIRKLNPEKKV